MTFSSNLSNFENNPQKYKRKKNPKMSKNIKKKIKKKKMYIYNNNKKPEENTILLVLIIGLRPELSSPPCFRIHGGSPERYGGRTERALKSLCVILDC